MTLLPIPTAPRGITPSWLTNALAPQLASENIHVTSVDSETIAVGEGFAAGLARLTIEFDHDPAPVPNTLIAKMPSPHEPTRNLLTALGAYEREVRFYQNAASEVRVRTPKCFLAGWDTGSSRFVLLLEDMAALRSQDQILGCPIDDAEVVVTELARLHASLWNSPMLSSWDWAPSWDKSASLLSDNYQMWWNQLGQKYPALMPDEFRRTADILGPHIRSIKARLAQNPVALVHGDYRVDNMFFEDSDSGTSLVVFDWQSVGIGRAPYDLAYFLGTSVDVDDRKSHGQNLKTLYHETLVRSGVSNYPRHDFDEDFDYALLDLVSFTVRIGAVLNFESIRSQKLAYAYMTRLSAALSEIDTERLVANLP